MPIPHEVNQRTARILHAKGIELTPTQVDQVRKGIYTDIRQQMKEAGWILPEDDEHMLAIITAARRNEHVLMRTTEAGRILVHPDFV